MRVGEQERETGCGGRCSGSNETVPGCHAGYVVIYRKKDEGRCIRLKNLNGVVGRLGDGELEG